MRVNTRYINSTRGTSSNDEMVYGSICSGMTFWDKGDREKWVRFREWWSVGCGTGNGESVSLVYRL